MSQYRAKSVRTTEEYFDVLTHEGEGVFYKWSITPRLAAASDTQRKNCHLVAGGRVIFWPELEEHLIVEGLFRKAI